MRLSQRPRSKATSCDVTTRVTGTHVRGLPDIRPSCRSAASPDGTLPMVLHTVNNLLAASLVTKSSG